MDIVQYIVWAGTHTCLNTFSGAIDAIKPAFSGLRTFALSRNIVLAAIVFIMSTSPFAVNVVCGGAYLVSSSLF